jgi:hypothetical protein
MSAPNQPIPIEELPSQSLAALRAVLACFPADPENKPHEFLASLHAKSLTLLADDIILLESRSRRESTPAIARVMLENLFNLGLALAHPELALEKALREWEWSLVQAKFKDAKPKELGEIRKHNDYREIKKEVESIGRKWGLPPSRIHSLKSYKISWCAEQAGMLKQYKFQYVLLCSFSHVASHTFFDKTLAATTGNVLATVTLCLLKAARGIAGQLNSIVPQELQGEVESLWKSFQTSLRLGDYQKLFESEYSGTPAPPPGDPERKFESN